MHAVPVQDVFALKVPAQWLEQAEVAAAGGEMPADLRQELEGMANATITRQYVDTAGLSALAIGKHEWLITRDPAEIEKFQPGDGCPACIEGNDKAIALLREQPDALVALGNLNYVEVWRD